MDESPLPRRGRLRRLAAKAALTMVSTLIIVSILSAADLYFHRKHGINIWGYRGPIAGQKLPGEKRIAVLGGSTAWGYGLSVGQDFPGQLQQQFNDARGAGGTSIRMLNLAYNAEGAYSFKYTLRDYDYLNYDVVLIYSGYNDLWRQNYFVSRHRSPIFLWTGYLPLLPALTMDKIAVWTNRLTKGNKPVVFSPPGTDAKSREETAKTLQKELGSLNGQSAAASPDGDCPIQWQFYCRQMYEAVDLALKEGKRVLVVTEPYISDAHVEQQQALEGMLNKRFQGQTRLRYLNLGPSIDLRDKSLCWDGMHLTEKGNRKIAEALKQPLLDILQ
jgi:lysophospholipase L1-like esterase